MLDSDHAPDASDAPDEAVTDAPEAAGRRALMVRWGWLGAALLIYGLTRLGQLAVLAWMRPPASGTLRDRLLAWDAGWFIRVAEEGYPHGYSYDPGGEITGNGLAFFPGFPLLIRLVHGVTRLDYRSAALVAGCLAGAAAAVAVYALGARLYGDRVGAVLCVLFCAQPMSVVLGMGYSEGLFVAFGVGALVAAHRRAWLTAGGLGLAASLTRPTGVAIAAALAVAAGMQLLGGQRRRSAWRPVAGAALALSGVPLYLAWVGVRVGNWHAWFDIQTAQPWGTTFDHGAGTWGFVVDTLRRGDTWVAMSVALLLIAAVIATWLALADRTWLPLVVYGLVALVLVVGQTGYYHSKLRLLVPVLLVLVPAAVALGRARARTAVPVLIGYVAFGLWYGAYMLTVWHYAI